MNNDIVEEAKERISFVPKSKYGKCINKDMGLIRLLLNTIEELQKTNEELEDKESRLSITVIKQVNKITKLEAVVDADTKWFKSIHSIKYINNDDSLFYKKEKALSELGGDG